MLTNFNYIW